MQHNQVANIADAKRFAKQANTYVDVLQAANAAYESLTLPEMGIGAFAIWYHLDKICTAAHPQNNPKYKTYIGAINTTKAKLRYWLPVIETQTKAIKLLLPLERLGVEIQKNQAKNK